ncbi:MAG: fumarate hydratase [Candidatus Methanogaster sp.]|uniref:Fumarate hydratase n=1 Tax=Candidatus Methanogaster sp. TaxID=3386292 RepID=A0AC61L2U7_9EURY|nr:MAG: fumarate hydratase [ANME-2 cluster archaeon]
MTTHHLSTPLTISDVTRLHAGDLVYLNGTVMTARDRACSRILAASEASEIPFDLENAVIYHCGPIVREVDENGSWDVIAAGPTTSSRLNSQTTDILDRFGVHAIIGKGGMSIADAMRDRCAYLAYTGGCAAVAAGHISSVRGVHWIDLGMAEAVWVLEVRDFGPLIVGIDSHGRNLFEEVQRRGERRMLALV